MDINSIDHFNDNDLALSVWKMKYRLNDESTQETLNRIVYNISKKIYYNICKDICDLGMEKIRKLGINRDLMKMYEKASDPNYDVGFPYVHDKIKQYIDYDKILPGGSVIFGIGNMNSYSSLSNCFVIDYPHDSIDGIHQAIGEMKLLEKARGGVGVNVSTIRPKGCEVKNQSKVATGVCLFVEEFSNENNVIAQDGRRGALMICLDILHPDIREFISLKQDLKRVTGANLSVLCCEEFMNKIIAGDEYILQRFPVDTVLDERLYNELISECEPSEIGILKKHNYGNNQFYYKVEKVKNIWDDIIHYAWKVAEPGVLFSGNWALGPDFKYPEYKPISTNPCVVGETLIMTKNGHQRIDSLIGTEVEIWNGEEWSRVIPQITGINQEVFEVELTDGTILPGVTRYHNFPIWEGWSRGGHEEMKQLKDLKIGDKISKFTYPVIEGELEIDEKEVYTQGFFSGDGSKKTNTIKLYGEKIKLCQYMAGSISENSRYYQDNIEVINFKPCFNLRDYGFIPGVEYNIKTRLNWLAGLIDADGCASESCNGLYGESCQISSTSKEFIKNLKLMLMTLGIESKYNKSKEARTSSFPLRDENYKTIGKKEYNCKELWRLTITSYDIQKLITLGLNTKRVSFNSVKNRDAKQFIKIKSIKSKGIAEKVYCFNELLKHKGIFNGILLGNCSEITLPAYDSCRLSSQNLFDVVNNPFLENSNIDFEKLRERSYWNLVITDTIIDLEIEHLENIISKIKNEENLPKNLKDNSSSLYEKIINITKKGRRCGCGFFAMGDMLAGLNKSYSKESLNIIENVCKTKMLGEVEASVDLASLRGSFEGYDPNLEKYNHIIKNIEHLDKNLFERMLKYGRRNVSWSTVAPTGTISILSGTTSGIEPLFEPFYKRRVKIFEGEADFTDVDGNKFKEFITVHPTFKKWIKIKIGLSDEQIKLLNSDELTKLFQESPWFGSSSNDIDPLVRIDILATVQRYTTHSISSTFNLPENVDKETISQIYLKSYEAGLKGNTVYRENSRAGVLVKSSNVKNVSKRPETLKGKIYKLKYRNHTYGICIGEIDKKPYELFILNGMGVLNESEEEIFEGEIKKVKRGDEWQYDFEGSLNETYDLQLADLNSMEAREEKLISLFISKLLRAAIDIEKICKLIEKSEPIAAKFSYRLNKILMKYYLKDKLLDEKCPNCGSFLTRQDGCVSCKNCGYSKC